MPAHRKETPRRVRPRVRRIAAATVSSVITGVALLGAAGVIPLGGAGSAATRDLADRVVGGPRDQAPATSGSTGSAHRSSERSAAGAARGAAPRSTPSGTSTQRPAPSTSSTSVPASSGSGKRVVFSTGAQRVWLVDSKNRTISTYLVSGSVTHNLSPGAYHVYSRSRWAVGVDDSGVMQYFVRFAHGPQAAIGFHSIPTKLGRPLQGLSELGTPQSHGCIRQKLSDAARMWSFATTGTEVVVVS